MVYQKVNLIHILLILGSISLTIFIYGFISEVKVGHRFLYILLAIALGFKLLKIIIEWYLFSGIAKTTKFSSTKSWTVDIFTTACPEEPVEMIEKTLRAMCKVEYPHKNYLCDEGNDPYLQKLCNELGVIHCTRSNRENAKAGNINNALKLSTGEICVILDPDHVPSRNFLDEVLPHFENPKIGFVQVVQAYKNQADSLVARAAAEQTYMFYGPYMRGMSNFGTAQAIGANCTFRRSALESIGGHAAGLTEDMHTSMLLHARGWESVFVPKIVSKGQVPNTLMAFYKQQLKWSRGTFDLWFHVFPFIFTKLTWRQRLHYGLLPIFYLFGFITLIDIAVPVYSLFSGNYPWQMDPLIFFLYFTPLLLFLVFIRLHAQKWLNEPNEVGLHLLGGILRVGSWWVFITGFIYTLFSIKVPYIPTPKAYDPKNEFFLGFPNLLLSIICAGAAIYGLNNDWHPYSFLMAGFAFSNSIILFMAFAIGQTIWVNNLRHLWIKSRTIFKMPNWGISYRIINNMAIRFIFFIPIIFFLLVIPYSFTEKNNPVSIDGDQPHPIDKSIGGFYTGIYVNDSLNNGLEEVLNVEKQVDHKFKIVSTYMSWDSEPPPAEYWHQFSERGSIPMITWEPWTNLFKKYENHPEISKNKRVFHYIINGYFDDYIDEMALVFRTYGSPAFLRFAHEMDNTFYPWSTSGGNTPEEFKAAWRYVYSRFEKLGVQNITWVWSPWKPTAFDYYFPNDKYYPHNRYIDWIGITSLNYGSLNPDRQWYSFKELYDPFHKKLKEYALNYPIMIAEFGSVSLGGDATSWVQEGLEEIQNNYDEIKSIVFFYNYRDKNIPQFSGQQKTMFIDWTDYSLTTISNRINSFEGPDLSNFKSIPKAVNLYRNKNIQGSFGSYSWMVDGEPFYIKGICYNPEHDWRDGFSPLTRKQLKKDFSRISSLGANTIRRYDPGIYDKNILKVAAEEGIKVMYGFWFDPAIDYYLDSIAKDNYEKKVIKHVQKFKDRKTIIAWNIGNETWGLQKKYFGKPYLTLTRKAYLDFLERIASKIQQIDPERPVFTSEEHENYQLAGTLHQLSVYAPSLDIIGINSYYKPNIENLQNMFSKFDTLRPYVITEFGPKGYWSHEFGDFRDDSILIELSSTSKAKWYAQQWKEYIVKHKSYNLGGFAFSWKDRYEGTSTWFGITDFKGRLKPAYYSLKSVWNDEYINLQFPDLHIVGPWYAFSPGKSLWLGVGISNEYNSSLKYEWNIYENYTWKQQKLIEDRLSDSRFIKIKLPKETKNLRIYVHAEDSLGNVITASRRLLME